MIEAPACDGASSTQRADSKIHESQRLGLLVNSFVEEVALGLGDDAEIDSEDVHEFRIGACAEGRQSPNSVRTTRTFPRKHTFEEQCCRAVGWPPPTATATLSLGVTCSHQRLSRTG